MARGGAGLGERRRASTWSDDWAPRISGLGQPWEPFHTNPAAAVAQLPQVQVEAVVAITTQPLSSARHMHAGRRVYIAPYKSQ